MMYRCCVVVTLFVLCNAQRDKGIDLASVGTAQLAPPHLLDEARSVEMWEWYLDFLPGMFSEIALLIAYLGLLARLTVKDTLGLEGISVQCVMTYTFVHFSRMWWSRY